MTEQISEAEHEDRIRRVQSVKCPRCGAGKGQPCTGPSGEATQPHHAARYQVLYRSQKSR